MHGACSKACHLPCDRYTCLITTIVAVYFVGFVLWSRTPTFAPAPHRPHDALNYSLWQEDATLATEGCCTHLNPLLCCTAPYNGTRPRPLRFTGAPPLDVPALWQRLRGRRVVLVGDSLMRQTLSALLCALTAFQTPLMAGPPPRSARGPQYDFEAAYGDGTLLRRLSMNRYTAKVLRSVLAKADVAVVNVGAWYNPPDRPQYERDARDMGRALAAHHRRRDRAVVLLDTVPQHFPTASGSGAFSDRVDGAACVPVSPRLFRTLGADWHTQALRSVASLHGLPFVEVLDVFLPRWDAHLERRPKTPTSGSGRLDCTHYCQQDSLWHPILARIAAAIPPPGSPTTGPHGHNRTTP